MKIKCPTGVEHSVEDAKTCEECKKIFPKPVLHSLLTGRDRAHRQREKPAYGVGLLVDNCLRHSYYKLTEEEILALDKLWVFSRGQAIHTFVTQTLGDEEKEIFVKKEFPAFDVIGFIDAKHDNVLYEFKTTTNIPEEPQKHHALQAQAYFSMLSPEEMPKIDKILVVYLSMDKVKTFEVPRLDITHFLEARAAQLTKAMRDKAPPAREVSWRCNYCEHQDVCFKRDKDK